MYKCKYFKIEELVSENARESCSGVYLWSLFDPNVLKCADYLREKFGPATINNWSWGGVFEQSGLRDRGTKHYNPRSQHSIGAALDIKFINHTAEEVRKQIKDMSDDFPFKIRIENGVNWLHIDTKPTKSKKQVYFFNP